MIFENRLKYFNKTNKFFAETFRFSFKSLLVRVIKHRLTPGNSRIYHDADQDNIKVANTDRTTNAIYK